jgi:hypothetical protein
MSKDFEIVEIPEEPVVEPEVAPTEQREAFIQRVKDLLEPTDPKYVLKGERSRDRNKIEYPGYCNGAKEKQRRLDSLVYSEGC